MVFCSSYSSGTPYQAASDADLDADKKVADDRLHAIGNS